jgi:TPR repeat protein
MEVFMKTLFVLLILLGELLLADGIAYLQKRCDDGHIRSCGALAANYASGFGAGSTDEKNLQAIKYFKLVCEQGSGNSCVSLSNVYRMNLKDLKNAKFYKKKALQVYQNSAKVYQQKCDQKDAEACAELALLYKEGDGVAKNLKKAMSLLEKSCDLNSGLGCGQLATILMEKDEPQKAIALFKKGYELNDAISCMSLVTHSLFFPDLIKPHDIQLYNRKACALGIVLSCKTLEAFKNL